MLDEKAIEAVKALAEVLKESEEYKTAMEKQEAYNTSDKIAKYMTEYSIQQELLTVEFSKSEEERDQAVMDAVQARIDDIYNAIVEDPVYVGYKEASEAYNAYYQEILTEMEFQITGNRSSCSGDCSSCGGCH